MPNPSYWTTDAGTVDEIDGVFTIAFQSGDETIALAMTPHRLLVLAERCQREYTQFALHTCVPVPFPKKAGRGTPSRRKGAG